MEKIREGVKIYNEEGLFGLLFSTWAHLGNRVYNRVLEIPILNYILGVLLPLQPGNSIWTLIGQCLCYYIFKRRSPYEETKTREVPMYVDRFTEIYNFYDFEYGTYIAHYLTNGLPNTRYYEYNFGKLNQQYFGGELHSPEPEDLLEGYRAVSFWTANRLMLGYNRYGIASKYIELTDKNISTTNVLDYGCGVADPAIYCGLKGATVTIVDLDTSVLKLAEARLSKRDLEYDSYAATQTEEPVKVAEDEFDFIIMSEFLEHVRNPMVFLEFAIDHLRTGGYFYDPVGREFQHTIHQQHLKEAKETVMSVEYKDRHQACFEHVVDNFYRRRIKSGRKE